MTSGAPRGRWDPTACRGPGKADWRYSWVRRPGRPTDRGRVHRKRRGYHNLYQPERCFESPRGSDHTSRFAWVVVTVGWVAGDALALVIAPGNASANVATAAGCPAHQASVTRTSPPLAVVISARIPVIEIGRAPRHANPCAVTHLSTIARVTIAAASDTGGNGAMRCLTRRRVAVIVRAGITVIERQDGRDADYTVAGSVTLGIAEAGISIRARSSRCDGRVQDANRGIAAVGCARVRIIRGSQGIGHALPTAIASLRPIAGIPIRTRRPRPGVARPRGGYRHGRTISRLDIECHRAARGAHHGNVIRLAGDGIPAAAPQGQSGVPEPLARRATVMGRTAPSELRITRTAGEGPNPPGEEKLQSHLAASTGTKPAGGQL